VGKSVISAASYSQIIFAEIKEIGEELKVEGNVEAIVITINKIEGLYLK
jgi:hypothetical protein